MSTNAISGTTGASNAAGTQSATAAANEALVRLLADHPRLRLAGALTEPDHAAMIALGLAVVAAVVIKSRRSRRDAANEDAAHKDPRL